MKKAQILQICTSLIQWQTFATRSSAFKGIIIRNTSHSPLVFEEHLLPSILHKSKTVSNFQRNSISSTDLNSELLKESRSILSKYQAAKSQLITFIKQHADKEKDENYARKKNALASKMLTLGTQLHAIYSLFSKDKAHHPKVFSDLHKKKKNLTNELFYCEYLLDTPHKKWRAYKDENEQIDDITVDSVIRSITAETNWYRLFMIRLKRLFTNIMPLIKSLNYQWFVFQINRINPILSYVAWLFYVPRLCANLYSLFIHTVPGFWMNEEQKDIGFETRFAMHWQRLWFEILNDAVWLAVGLACCFFLGTSGSIILTALLYFFDAGMAYVNSYLSVKHHHSLKDAVDEQMSKLNILLDEITNPLPENTNPDANDQFDGQTVKEELEILTEYQDNINKWIQYEQKRLILSVFVTTMFALSMTIGALPTLITLSAPLAIACPIISALIVVAICIAQYLLSIKIEASMPETNIAQLTDLQIQMAKSKDKQTELQTMSLENQETPAGSPPTVALNDSSFFSASKSKSLRRCVSCPEDLLELTNDAPRKS